MLNETGTIELLAIDWPIELAIAAAGRTPPGGPVDPPGGPGGPCCPCGPLSSVPGLKSWAPRVPSATFWDVTEDFLSCFVPTLFLGSFRAA
jgi:hypothetical protein